MTNQQLPVFILPEDAERTTGKDAQRNNIAAAKAVSQTVRTTLGPKGMDKMLVDSIGDVIVTNDGVTILDEMKIEHPAAKMVVEVAQSQEDEVGDGTTTAVVLAGELLKNAEDLLDQEIHPSIIAKGYRLAQDKAQEILNDIAEDVSTDDEEVLQNIAATAMTGKGAESAKDYLAELAVEAVTNVLEAGGQVNRDDIKIETKVGDSIRESTLVDGIVIDKDKVHSSMPSKVDDASILLLNKALEVEETEMDANIQIDDPSKMEGFLKQEEEQLQKMVEKIAETGANVVFCQKGIDDMAQHYLAKEDILAVRRVSKSDMEKLSRATGAKVTNNLDDIEENDLGYAGKVSESTVAGENMIAVEECENPQAVTLILKGGTEHVVDETERAITDSIGDIVATLQDGKAVGGAGSCEIELVSKLKEYASQLKGREQLAVNAFAAAMEIVPRTLAENAGMDPIDVMTESNAAHDDGRKWSGINVFDGEITDAWDEGVMEPLKIKSQAIGSAAEVSEMILRIDDVITGAGDDSDQGAGAPGGPGGAPGGMPGGMGGMGGLGGL